MQAARGLPALPHGTGDLERREPILVRRERPLLRLEARHDRRRVRARPARDGFPALAQPVEDVGVDVPRRLAEATENVVGKATRRRAVTLPLDDVEQGLDAHELGDGRDHDGPAELLPDARDLVQDLGKAPSHAQRVELMLEIAAHAARHLMPRQRRFGRDGPAERLVVKGGLIPKMTGDAVERGGVETDPQSRSGRFPGHEFRGWVRGPVGERRYRRLRHVDAEAHGLDGVEGAEAGGAVGLEVEQRPVPDRGPQPGEQRPQPRRRHEGGGVLQDDAVHPESQQFAGPGDVVVVRMDRTLGEYQGARDVQPLGPRRRERRGHVGGIVEAVEQIDQGHAVPGHQFHREGEDLVGQGRPAEDAQAADDRGDVGVPGRPGDEADALPRVFGVEMIGRLVDGAAHHLDAPVPARAHVAGDGRDHGRGHARRPQALLAVPQRGLPELQGSRHARRAARSDRARPDSAPQGVL